MKIGFIGVGNMGGPMCRNIIKNTNHEVTVFDLAPAAVKRCTDLGAAAGTSVAALASRSDVVITSLPMPRHVHEVALERGGIGENAKPGTVYIDLSTNAPSMARRVHEGLAAKGIAMLEAPVSGGVAGAEAASIVIMVGGDEAVFESQRPLLAAFSKEVVHVGPVGMASVAKLINNQLAFSNMAAAAEALMIGAMSGIDLGKLNQVIENASGFSWAYRSLAAKAFAGDY
ncbi:MAG: NAD(P)-dependent oxidoreductase, partial [Alphaproteobacteria bacterium]|nr:NAD(P)-dependent oxidoreductase [Alphaproteobacteria bacterium]